MPYSAKPEKSEAIIPRGDTEYPRDAIAK